VLDRSAKKAKFKAAATTTTTLFPFFTLKLTKATHQALSTLGLYY
jgi:hypothetical protein